jgi:hypothetical protein
MPPGPIPLPLRVRTRPSFGGSYVFSRQCVLSPPCEVRGPSCATWQSPPEVLHREACWWNGENPRLVISFVAPIDAPAELAQARGKNPTIGDCTSRSDTAKGRDDWRPTLCPGRAPGPRCALCRPRLGPPVSDMMRIVDHDGTDHGEHEERHSDGHASWSAHPPAAVATSTSGPVRCPSDASVTRRCLARAIAPSSFSWRCCASRIAASREGARTGVDPR